MGSSDTTSGDAEDGPPEAPSVTVVITTRNRLDWLQEAVASVEAQTFRGWELVVVDDASTDGTSDWLRGREGPRFTVVQHEERSERATGRNDGLHRARGHFTMFLDDDDRLTPDALSALVGAASSSPTAIGASGARVVFDADGNRKRWLHVRKTSVRDVADDVIFGWLGNAGECVVRTDLLRSLGGFRGELIPVEDQEVWLRLAELGPVALVPDVVLEYRRHDGQYRPPDTDEIEDRIRVEHVATLSGRAAIARSAALTARRHFRRSLAVAESDRPRGALLGVVAAIRAAPSLLMSPLSGTILRRGLIRAAMLSIAGSRGRRLLLAVLWRIRSMRGTAVRVDRSTWREESS